MHGGVQNGLFLVPARRGHSIALDIARGLGFLHRHGIAHLDIKSPNVLLTADGRARIADLGLGRLVVSQGEVLSQVRHAVPCCRLL
jgi:serine/threonine protein kinase